MPRVGAEEVVIFQGFFEPQARQLQRIVHCLVKAGRSCYLRLTSEGLTMVQKPTMGSSARNVTSWSHFRYPLLGLREVIVTDKADVAFEMQLSLFWSILQGIASNSLAALQLLSSGVLCILSKSQAIGPGDLVAGKEGVISHEMAVSILDPLEVEILAEPIVARPVLSFHLPAPAMLRSRLSTLSVPILHVSANPQGTFMVRGDEALLQTSLKFSAVRIVDSSSADAMRLVGALVDRIQLVKALTHSAILPAGLFSTICAIIPDEALIISVSLEEFASAIGSTHGEASSSGNIMTFYIPASS